VQANPYFNQKNSQRNRAETGGGSNDYTRFGMNTSSATQKNFFSSNQNEQKGNQSAAATLI